MAKKSKKEAESRFPMTARTALCKNRQGRLAAMSYNLICKNGMPVEAIEQEGFNDLLETFNNKCNGLRNSQ